jgi:hypothetical protein
MILVNSDKSTKQPCVQFETMAVITSDFNYTDQGSDHSIHITLDMTKSEIQAAAKNAGIETNYLLGSLWVGKIANEDYTGELFKFSKGRIHLRTLHENEYSDR